MFLSYRREDTSPYAGRIYDRLSDRFGESHVFMDVDSIGLGLDFVEVLRRAVASCQVMLVLVGPRWLEGHALREGHGLHDRSDYVRLEVETGLERAVRVVPILVGGASLPPSSELPESLRPLLRRQALELGDSTFRSDVGLLIEQLATVLVSDTPNQVLAGDEGTRASPTWSAEALRESKQEVLLRVQLANEHHLVHFNIADFTEKIRVDETTVASKWGGNLEGTYAFAMSDGPETRTAVADINRTKYSARFTTIRLTIDGTPVYAWAS